MPDFFVCARCLNLYLPPATEEQLVPYTWTEDDEELLASSMEDMESETLEGY